MSPKDKKNMTEYCRYHREYGHMTKNCRALRQAIEKLINEGHLSEYVKKDPKPRHEDHKEEQKAPEHADFEINVIMGGTETGISHKARKDYARQARRGPEPQILMLTESNPGVPSITKELISFSEEDARGIHHPHNDALVISLFIAGRKVHRIMVDTGSSVDVLYKAAFDRMRLIGHPVEPLTTPLVGFTGNIKSSEGRVRLLAEMGDKPNQRLQSINFMLVDCPSSYNAIIGRPTLNAIRAVVSTYSMTMKFPTFEGTGVIRGDQVVSRDTYLKGSYVREKKPIGTTEQPEKEKKDDEPLKLLSPDLELDAKDKAPQLSTVDASAPIED